MATFESCVSGTAGISTSESQPGIQRVIPGESPGAGHFAVT